MGITSGASFDVGLLDIGDLFSLDWLFLIGGLLVLDWLLLQLDNNDLCGLGRLGLFRLLIGRLFDLFGLLLDGRLRLFGWRLNAKTLG